MSANFGQKFFRPKRDPSKSAYLNQLDLIVISDVVNDVILTPLKETLRFNFWQILKLDYLCPIVKKFHLPSFMSRQFSK